MKKLLFILFTIASLNIVAQTALIRDHIIANQSFTLNGKKVTGISTDSSASSKSPFLFITERAAKLYADSLAANGVNIYKADGFLINNRTLDGAAFNLKFQNLSNFSVGANGGSKQLIITADSTALHSPDESNYISVANGYIVTKTPYHGIFSDEIEHVASGDLTLKSIGGGISIGAENGQINLIGNNSINQLSITADSTVLKSPNNDSWLNVKDTAISFNLPGDFNLRYNFDGDLVMKASGAEVFRVYNDGTVRSISGYEFDQSGGNAARLAHPLSGTNQLWRLPNSSGTLALTSDISGLVSAITGTSNRITSTGGTTPQIDISSSYVGQSSITTVGTLTSGATGAGFTIALGTSTITGVLPIANGGTNSSTALSNNRVMKSSSGSIIEAAAITANRALISDANGIPTHSSVTNAELGYVSGVTSSIQTQINNSFFGKTDVTFGEHRGVSGSDTYGFGFNNLASFNLNVFNGSTGSTRGFMDDATTEFYSPYGLGSLSLQDGQIGIGTGSLVISSPSHANISYSAGGSNGNIQINHTVTGVGVVYYTYSNTTVNHYVGGINRFQLGYDGLIAMNAPSTKDQVLVLNRGASSNYNQIVYTNDGTEEEREQIGGGLHKWVTAAGNALTLNQTNGKLSLLTGSNKSTGTATLSSGTVTINNTAVTSSSLIYLTYDTPSGTLASGLSAPSGSIVNGTSFVINSLTTAAVVNTLDNSTVRWWIIN